MSWKRHFRKHLNIALLGALFVVLGAVSWSLFKTYGSDIADFPKEFIIAEPPKPKHVPTPEPVKAIYMTSWVAGTRDWRRELVEFIKKSEINSLVIDVKDYTGRIAFDTGDEIIKDIGSEEVRVSDMEDFIESLHDAGIYAIARITVFQDPYYSKKRPEISVQRKSKSGALWKDKKGLSYIDPAAKEFWDYTVRVARAAERVGFDELNFDYIRFPSDGNMSDIAFPVSEGFVREKGIPPLNPPLVKGGRGGVDSFSGKVLILTEFFKYLRNELKDVGVPISADVFGMVATNYDDLNIGQVLEAIAPHFDYVAPMVYPSHYPHGFQKYKNPAVHPYEIVHYSMSKAVERLSAPTSTPSKLRPWLQDFDLGANYDATKVRAQIQAVYDSGLTSWMSWDAGNKYTREAYDLE